MGIFYVPSTGPQDWQKLLADPEKHWAAGYSAKALAYSWQTAEDFPPEVKKVLDASEIERLQRLEFLLGLPEHKTPVPGRGRASQSDIFVLAKSHDELMAVTIEGKVDEKFGETVSEWNPEKSQNKQTRLSGLCELLELPISSVGKIRYQLLHRTASALIEARRFNATAALMLVHSFSRADTGFDDYAAFLGLFDERSSRHNVIPNSVSYAGEKGGIQLFLAWVRGDARFLKA